jgi:anti-sigma regulatory factor (Ser/Thr protein kinase)
VSQLEPENSRGGLPWIERPQGRLLMQLPALAENVSLVRDTVKREAEAMGMGPREVDDLRTVVSEACNNAVLHAYPAAAKQRPLEVELRRQGDALEVVVRDRGRGMHPRGEEGPDSLRLGLSLIGSLASHFVLRSGHEQGTELAVTIPLATA